MNFVKFNSDNEMSRNSSVAFVSLHKVHILPFENTDGIVPIEQISLCIQTLAKSNRKDSTKTSVFNLLVRLMKHSNLSENELTNYKTMFHQHKHTHTDPIKNKRTEYLSTLYKLGEYRKYVINVLHFHGITEREMKSLPIRPMKRNENGISSTDKYVYIFRTVDGKLNKIKLLGKRIVTSFQKINRFHLLDQTESLVDFIQV